MYNYIYIFIVGIIDLHYFAVCHRWSVYHVFDHLDFIDLVLTLY